MQPGKKCKGSPIKKLATRKNAALLEITLNVLNYGIYDRRWTLINGTEISKIATLMSEELKDTLSIHRFNIFTCLIPVLRALHESIRHFLKSRKYESFRKI